MPLVSRKGILAITAVIDVAINARLRPVSAKALAARHTLPPRHLEPVLQALVREGILRGVRGPRGGYRLAKERRRISVGDIVRAAETADEENGEDNAPRSELGAHIVAPFIQSLQGDVMAKLDSITVDDLCQRARAAGVDMGEKITADFTI